MPPIAMSMPPSITQKITAILRMFVCRKFLIFLFRVPDSEMFQMRLSLSHSKENGFTLQAIPGGTFCLPGLVLYDAGHRL